MQSVCVVPSSRASLSVDRPQTTASAMLLRVLILLASFGKQYDPATFPLTEELRRKASRLRTGEDLHLAP